MKAKRIIENVLATVGLVSFAGCGGYCDAGNFVGAVIAMAVSFACFYPIVKEFERNEARKKVVPYKYSIQYEEVLDAELPKAQ